MTLTCTHCRELMKLVGMLWYVVSAIHVAVAGPWTCVWPVLLFKQIINSFLWSVFLFSLGCFANGFWYFGQLWNIQFLIIGSSPNSSGCKKSQVLINSHYSWRCYLLWNVSLHLPRLLWWEWWVWEASEMHKPVQRAKTAATHWEYHHGCWR